MYGQLAKIIGQRVFHAVISTPAEAFRFLIANYPHAKQHILNQVYAIYVGDYRLASNEHLNDPLGQQELRIIPLFSGNFDIIGAIVDFATTAVPVVATAAISVGFAYLSAELTKSASQVGVSPSQSSKNKDPRVNFSFNGIQNTSRAGVPLPIVYGEIITGSVVASAGLDTVQVKG